MSKALAGVDAKLQRAIANINTVYQLHAAYGDSEPYTVRVQEESDGGQRAIRLIAVKNPAVGPPDPDMLLLAGEIVYQLRSALDHLIHQLVIANGQGAKLVDSRRHQFPIFETSDGYKSRAGGMIDEVANAAATLIERDQPYNRRPSSPRKDPLWILQDLNNTDKHRGIPTCVVGIDVVEITHGGQVGEVIGTVQSPDIGLKDGEVFFSLTASERYQDIRAKVSCAVAFEQAMSPHGVTLGIDGVLMSIIHRVSGVVSDLRFLVP